MLNGTDRKGWENAELAALPGRCGAPLSPSLHQVSPHSNDTIIHRRAGAEYENSPQKSFATE